jgi:chemotaxis protein CheC
MRWPSLPNIAMARAAVSLRTMIEHEMLLSVPNVEILAPKEAIARVAKPGTFRRSQSSDH